MEKGMEEPYIEGVAIHGDPESCVGVREDAGEALTGARAGWAIEPRNHHFGVPTPSHEAEGHTAGSVSASCQRTPRGLTSSRTIGLGASWPGELARGIQQAVGPAGTSAVLGLRRVGRWALRSET